MILSDILELKLFPIEDRGVPNRERVAIHVQETVNMGQFGIMVGFADINNTARPFLDNLFWFADSIVNRGDWIIIYTGNGNPTVIDWEEPGTKLYSLHWGRETTIFANSNIVPILFRINSVVVGTSPKDLPQQGLLPAGKNYQY